YVRRWIGYGWWRRFHYLAFAVFALATVHGLGSGSDTRQPWALGLYVACTGSVLALTAWRLVSATRLPSRTAAAAGLAVAAVTLVVFTLVGPTQAGWNATANNGKGSGASAAWMASHPSPTGVRPTTSFSADLQATFARGVLSGSFAGGYPGSLELRTGRGTSDLSITFADGWSCVGAASDPGDETISATCVGADGSIVEVTLSGLYQTQQGVIGQLTIRV
ncbi:MAG: hypothetical protein M3R49_05115, partial [Chloroflexota bacterium]|nr:hypothetical protein [Chloroflexota bacterium]